MIEQILLNSSSFEGVRETGGFGQPLHALYPQIRAVLAKDVEPDAAFLLAEPVVDRARNRIDWYTEGDPDQPPVALNALPDEQQQSILARVEDLLNRGRALAQRYAASEDSRRAQVGTVLHAVLLTPAKNTVFLVDGRPVMTGWGFGPDRPWEAPEGSEPRSPVRTEPSGAVRDGLVPDVAMESAKAIPRDVAMPDVAIPDLATAVPELTPQPPALPTEPTPPRTEEAAVSPLLESGLSKTPPESPESLSSETVDTALPRTAPKPLPESVADSSSATAVSPPGESLVERPVTSSLLHYVVVGSRYFWGVVVIAIVLVLLAAYWALGRKDVSSVAITDNRAPPAVEASAAKMAGALSDAQRVESELRGQLERLLVQLAGRRGQCVLPQGSGAAIPDLAPKIGGDTGTLPVIPPGRADLAPPMVGDSSKPPPTSAPTPIDRRISTETVLPGQPPPRVVPGTGVAAGTKVVPGTGVAADTGVTSATGAAPVTAVTPTEIATTPHVTPTMPGTTERSPAKTGSTLPVSPTPSSPPSSVPAVDTTKVDATKAATPPSTTPPSAISTAPRPAGGESSAPTLEESLMEKGTVSTPSLPQTPPAKPPVKAEPTPDERREFTNRMSETGAMTGETTVTLLWDSHADLDLVVRCPSGQQLDFRNPAECGGTLDVDANATRNSLSDRPVENAFWPASKAGPGSYEIAVRYAPRKDEERSQETPFQVRLIRGGQESVFKGTVRPHAMVPITTFTVKP